jgi:DNA primase large subunit
MHLLTSVVLAEIEACSFRNKSPAETAAHINPLLREWLPLSSNTSSPMGFQDEKIKSQRRKDHYSHYILRLAFSSTEELRRRFLRVETALFKLRFQYDDARERQEFIESLDLAWEMMLDEEKRNLGKDLLDATPGLKRQDLEEGGWFKVNFELVPELVESRKILIKAGKAYVPSREQLSMVLASFIAKLDRGLEV